MLYKRYFDEISSEDIYKWRAVKCFQENGNTDAGDFAEMLNKSLAVAKILFAVYQFIFDLKIYNSTMCCFI